MIKVHRTLFKSESAARRAPDLAGRNPANRKRSLGRPDAVKAANDAEGPGTGNTAIPSFRAALTSLCPGSDTSGVPASETSARRAPPLSLSSNVGRILGAL